MTTTAVVANRGAGVTAAGATNASATLYADTRLLAKGAAEPRYSVAGVKMRGQPASVQSVAATNARTGHVQTGELMWGRTNSGRLLFWIKSSNTPIILRGSDGQAVTNPTAALARARELIRYDAAPRLRDLGAPVAMPSIGTASSTEIVIDLEQSAESGGVNRRGGSGRAVLGLVRRGQAGSALTCGDAVARAQALGVPVRVTNLNPGLSAGSARMGAWLTLPNTEAGGRLYANITANRGDGNIDVLATSYSVPAGANEAFRRGFTEVDRQIAAARLLVAGQNLSSGAISMGAQARGNLPASRPGAPFGASSGASSQPGSNKPAAPQTTGGRPSLKQVVDGRLARDAPVVANMAAALGVSTPTARKVMDSLGGNYDTQSAIHYLQQQHGLSRQKATSLVQAVRSAQNQSTRNVKATIDTAAARTDAAGASSPRFSQQDWATVAIALKAQPKVDNVAARLLTRMLSDPRFVKAGQSTIENRAQIEGYVRSVGGPAKRVVPPTGGTAGQQMNPTVTDADFARLVARTGLGQQDALRIGVVDRFHQSAAAANRMNTDAVTPMPASSRRQQRIKLTDGQHGGMVGATATAGTGRYLRVQSAYSGNLSAIKAAVDTLVSSGVRVINCSFAFKELQSAVGLRSLVDRHPKVLFVMAGGNGKVDSQGYDVGAHTRDSALGVSLLASRRNVLYVGNVDSAGQINSTSTYGTPGPHLYALGTDVVVPDARNRYSSVSGSSAAAPQVARAVGLMLFLDSKMSVTTARGVVMQTARGVQQKAPHALAGQSVAVLDAQAATTVAALTGLVRRGGPTSTLSQAADRLKLNTEQRVRLLPLAAKALSTRSGAAPSATTATSSTSTTGSTSSTSNSSNTSRNAQNTRAPNSVRVTATGDATTDALFSTTPVRVTYPEGATHPGSFTPGGMKRLIGGLDNTQVEARNYEGGGVVLDVIAKRGTSRLRLWVDDSSGTLWLLSDRGVWRLKNDAADPARATLPRAIAVAAAQGQAQGLRRISISVREGGAMAHVRLAEIGFSNIQGQRALQASIPSRYAINGAAPDDIAALRSSVEGRTWWRENGHLAGALSFDLTPGSASWRTLQTYLRAHDIRLPAGFNVPRDTRP